MAKHKIKMVPFDAKATEVKSGVWAWMVGGRMWQWSSAMGLNVGIVGPNDGLASLVYIPKLEGAAYFAQGYEAGYNQRVFEQLQQPTHGVSKAETPGGKPTKVTHQQLYIFLSNDGNDGEWTYKQWREDLGDRIDGPCIVDESLFDALRAADIKSVVVSKEMSENHLGGDDICSFAEETLKAVKEGYEVTVWYGDHAEVLIAGFKSTELEIIEADYVLAGEAPDEDDEEEDGDDE